MWSRNDEFLSICMGIAIRGDRQGDYAYLDPLCWKLPDCDYKKAHVWRADSLVFGKNNHLISNRIHFEPTLAIY